MGVGVDAGRYIRIHTSFDGKAVADFDQNQKEINAAEEFLEFAEEELRKCNERMKKDLFNYELVKMWNKANSILSTAFRTYHMTVIAKSGDPEAVAESESILAPVEDEEYYPD